MHTHIMKCYVIICRQKLVGIDRIRLVIFVIFYILVSLSIHYFTDQTLVLLDKSKNIKMHTWRYYCFFIISTITLFAQYRQGRSCILEIICNNFNSIAVTF